MAAHLSLLLQPPSILASSSSSSFTPPTTFERIPAPSVDQSKFTYRLPPTSHRLPPTSHGRPPAIQRTIHRLFPPPASPRRLPTSRRRSGRIRQRRCCIGSMRWRRQPKHGRPARRAPYPTRACGGAARSNGLMYCSRRYRTCIHGRETDRIEMDHFPFHPFECMFFSHGHQRSCPASTLCDFIPPTPFTTGLNQSISNPPTHSHQIAGATVMHGNQNNDCLTAFDKASYSSILCTPSIGAITLYSS